MQGSGFRVEGGGWRVEGGGWRAEGGGCKNSHLAGGVVHALRLADGRVDEREVAVSGFGVQGFRVGF